MITNANAMAGNDAQSYENKYVQIVTGSIALSIGMNMATVSGFQKRNKWGKWVPCK